MFLGENLLPFLTLAIGAALSGGTAMALLRPRLNPADNELSQPPLIRSLAMIAIGAVATIWALATLLS